MNDIARPKKYTYDFVKNFIDGSEGNGCKLLSETYINSREKIEIKCKCGNIFLTNFSRFINNDKRRCNDCANVVVWNYEKVKKFIEVDSNSNCKLLSDEYIRCTDKLKLECECGNIFLVRFTDFNSRNKRQCNTCGWARTGIKNSKSEDDFKQKLFNLYHGEYELLGTYTSSATKTKIRHKCGYIWNVQPNIVLQRVGAPNVIHLT